MGRLHGLRKSYESDELDEADTLSEPLAQFHKWFEQAERAGVPEPNAMTLATVGADGRPSTRVVLIKDVDERGIVWYTNYLSRKGQELAANPFAALQFHWVELERVVRIEGRVEKVDPAQSDAYFAVRPLDSRIGAWASPQSQVIASRGVLLKNVAEVTARYGLNPPRPSTGAATAWYRTPGSSGRGASQAARSDPLSADRRAVAAGAVGTVIATRTDLLEWFHANWNRQRRFRLRPEGCRRGTSEAIRP